MKTKNEIKNLLIVFCGIMLGAFFLLLGVFVYSPFYIISGMYLCLLIEYIVDIVKERQKVKKDD